MGGLLVVFFRYLFVASAAHAHAHALALTLTAAAFMERTVAAHVRICGRLRRLLTVLNTVTGCEFATIASRRR